MTLTIRTHNTKTHHITMEAEGTGLIVQACPFIGDPSDHLVGYPQNKAVYHHTERKNANATFRRYVKKYSEV